MKLTSDMHVAGAWCSGLSGILGCHVYVLNSGSELALIDPGLGLAGDFVTILYNIRADGIDLKMSAS